MVSCRPGPSRAGRLVSREPVATRAEIAVFARAATPRWRGVALPRCNLGLSTAERSVAEAVSLSCGGGMRSDLRPALAVSPTTLLSALPQPLVLLYG